MIKYFLRYSIAGVIYALTLPIISSNAQDAGTLEKLEAQDLLIQRQNQRIERLEEALETLLQNPQAATPYGEPEGEGKTESKPANPQSPAGKDVADGADPFAGKRAPKKGYDPEKSFFGPLPRFTSPSGYSFGFSGFFQYDGALYGQESGSNVPDYRDGTRLKNTAIFLTGVFPKDWIWGLYYNLADSGDAPINGLYGTFAIYRGFAPWWIMLGNQRSGVGLDPSAFSSSRTSIWSW